MSKLKETIDKVLLSAAAFLLTAMVVLSIWQVLARYVLNVSSPGTEESIRFLLIWFGLISAAYVFGAKKHIAILFFREKFNSKTQLVFKKITDAMIILLAAVLMIYGGMKIVLLASAQTAAATGISMAIVYAALPVSGLFIIIYTIHSMVSNNTQQNDEEVNVS